jgi:glycosyltransferase involved in cell wall biosynthesis
MPTLFATSSDGGSQYPDAEVGELRIFMLSWEYPPRIIGGLARHVEGLSKSLASMGHEVHVVTLDFPGAAYEEEKGSLYIHRVVVDLPAPTFHTWVLLFNHFFEKRLGQLARKFGLPDVVHVHDWLTVSGGVAAKHLLRAPLVMTFHSTEASRSSNSPSPESAMVEGLEWWGSFESARIIAVSGWMKSEVVSMFKVPEDKVAEIPNAVDPQKFEGPVDIQAIRSKWNVKEGERLITAVGRLTSQKGFDDLIKAYPMVRRAIPSSRLLIVGDGYMRGELESLAEQENVRGSVTFAGFVSESDLVGALRASDAVVVPSRFEPFGIIALEAMAAGVPIVVSRVGGLAEIVEDRVDGMEVEPNNPPSIAEAITEVLSDGMLASRLARRGKEKAKAYSWNNAAMKTLQIYQEAAAESRYE